MVSEKSALGTNSVPSSGTMHTLAPQMASAIASVSQLVRQRPAVARPGSASAKAVCGAVEPAGDAADGFVVKVAARARGACVRHGLSMLGSCQTLDSMGSSVKLTNIEISTAATTVMPNSWKNLPMMPPMKPIGKNTATMRQRGGQHRQADLLRAVERGLVGGSCPSARGARCSRAPRWRRRSAGPRTGSAPSASSC